MAGSIWTPQKLCGVGTNAFIMAISQWTSYSNTELSAVGKCVGLSLLSSLLESDFLFT